MKRKTCFKCARSLPLTDFYRHPAMADGRLGKCVDCAKRDVALRRETEPEKLAAYERKRYATKERRAAVRRYAAAYRKTHAKEVRARQLVAAAVRAGVFKPAPCGECGSRRKVEAHHDDYDKPLDIRWLCETCHKRHHKENP